MDTVGLPERWERVRLNKVWISLNQLIWKGGNLVISLLKGWSPGTGVYRDFIWVELP